MKLNMGCGHNKIAGYLNVDSSPLCEPDQVYDLEKLPWPWQDDSVEEVLFYHSLEHLGGDPKIFLAMMQELYRICTPGAIVKITTPHPRHDNFIGDPTHVRIISPQVLSLFSKKMNDEWKRLGIPNSPLAHYLGIDFEITGLATILDEPYSSYLQKGLMTKEQIMNDLREKNNVVTEFKIEMEVIKSAPRTGSPTL
jgi:hypothetical protein